MYKCRRNIDGTLEHDCPEELVNHVILEFISNCPSGYEITFDLQAGLFPVESGREALI